MSPYTDDPPMAVYLRQVEHRSAQSLPVLNDDQLSGEETGASLFSALLSGARNRELSFSALQRSRAVEEEGCSAVGRAAQKPELPATQGAPRRHHPQQQERSAAPLPQAPERKRRGSHIRADSSSCKRLRGCVSLEGCERCKRVPLRDAPGEAGAKSRGRGRREPTSETAKG